MSSQQVMLRKQEIENHINSSFDQINNFIDQVFIKDSPIPKINNTKLEFQYPKYDQFHLIGQSEFIAKIQQEMKPLIKSKIQNQVQIQQQKEKEHQQSLQQFQQIKSPSQLNLKPFSYQISQDNFIKQKESCLAIAISKDCSIVAAGCDKQIKIYEFKEGILNFNQILNQHKNEVVILNFMKYSNQLISGDDRQILIWTYNNKSWICSQTINGHNNWIRCLILNDKEDLFISSSNDKTIKFWIKQNEWICQQTITDHTNDVYQISLNEQQNQVISCGYDKQILVIQQSESNKNWNVKQKIQVNSEGYRLCFIKDDIFTFQPKSENLMHVYQLNSVSQQFSKSQEIILNQGNEGRVLFPQQFIKQKQLLVNKHDKFVNLIRFTENGEFKFEQSIEFGTNFIFGQMSDDGEYLITWDQTSTEIQLRKFKEK